MPENWMQNRAKLLPGSKNGQPIIMWDGEPVRFPVQDELVLHATEGGTPPPPQAKVIDASGRVLCTYEASLEEVITETAEAEVRARARATVERLQALLETGRTALAARPGGPAGSDMDDDHDEDDYDEDDEEDDSFSVSVEVSGTGARSPMRAFLRHASRGAAAYLIWAFLLPLIETMVAGMPGEGGILFITAVAGLFLPIIAFLNGIAAVFDLFDML
ncbi:MAG TPA: hypothetical protein VFR81_20180 [Longimicrobium sp.]|nr:hypothetical protein [Longimicrobium sp.]